MLTRSIVLILLVTSTFILSVAQSPEARKTDEVKKTSASAPASRSYLGIRTQEINNENFAKFGLKEVNGVAIEEVMENSPASLAGLLAGDVIVAFNGEEVTGDRKLIRLIGEVDPDHKAKITVLRNSRKQQITAIMGKQAVPAVEDTIVQMFASSGRKYQQLRDLPFPGGVDLQYIIKELARDLDLNILFDTELFRSAKRKTSIDLRNVTAAMALDHIFLQERLFFQKAGPKAILIAHVSQRSRFPEPADPNAGIK